MGESECGGMFHLELAEEGVEEVPATQPGQPSESWVCMVEEESPQTPPLPCSKQAVDDLKLLWGKYTDLKDSLHRFELLLNQGLCRLDAQLNTVVAQQRKDSRAIFEMRGVIQALVAEVGEELVDSRLQAAQQQALLRQHEVFHRDFSSRSEASRGRGAGGTWVTPTRGGASHYDANDHWRRKAKTGKR